MKVEGFSLDYDKQLVLEDGTILKGYGFGGSGECEGEVVFNTSMTGYQEALSDPSYLGQLLTFTYPLIGNYGINSNDFESRIPTVRGVVVREVCRKPSNYQSKLTLTEFLSKHNIPAIQGIDTRYLTKRLRTRGVMRGVIVDINADTNEVIRRLNSSRGEDLIVAAAREVFIKEPPSEGEGIYRVGLLNLGTKDAIVRQLRARGCEIVTFPYNTTLKEIDEANLDGLVISNGPGDPEDAPETIELTRQLIGRLPILGICMGHLIIGLACNARVYKLTFGHRSSNHPVKNLLTGGVEITSQNHGYAIDTASLEGTDLELTYVGLNDNACEGFRHRRYPVFSVQFHPESCPGPQDSLHIFDTFVTMLREGRDGQA